jgi:succinate dehydrogenase / fumarate reductase cytochrome b subunit
MSSSPLAGDPTNDPSDDQSGRFVRQPNGRVRPLSPHLQIWRFHITMWASILSRIAAGALYFGILVLAAWVACAAFGPDAYGAFGRLAASPLGLLIWFGLTLGLVYHLFSGVRHLVWDTGAGLTPKSADTLSHVSIWGSIIVVVAFWVGLFMTGKVSL